MKNLMNMDYQGTVSATALIFSFFDLYFNQTVTNFFLNAGILNRVEFGQLAWWWVRFVILQVIGKWLALSPSGWAPMAFPGSVVSTREL